MAKSYKFTPAGQILKVISHGLGTNRRGTLVDESGKNHNGTIKGPVLTLDGNDHVSVAVPWKNLFGFTYARFACWLYADSSDSSSRFLMMQDFSGSDSQIDIAMLADDTIKIFHKGAVGDAQRSHNDPWTVSQDVWHSLIVEIKGGDDQINIWLDGVQETVNGTPGAISAWEDDTPGSIFFGATADNSDHFKGFMRWIGLTGSNTALTTADAQAFHNHPPNVLTSFDGWWPCNEGTNVLLRDLSGNGHTVTLTGASWTIDQVPGIYVNADTVMGVSTTAAGYVDLVTTDKISQGATLSTAEGISDTLIAYYFDAGDLTANFEINEVVFHSAEATWHRITAVNHGEHGGGSADDMKVTVTPAVGGGDDWVGIDITAYKGQMQLLSEDAFAICMWFTPALPKVSFTTFVSDEIDPAKSLRIIHDNAVNSVRFHFEGTDDAQNIHTASPDGELHSFVGVLDNSATGGAGALYSWIDAVDPETDATYSGLLGGNPEFIRLGARANDGGNGNTDSFGPFCLIDLSDITGGVDQEVREGIRDAWDDADMDYEVFFADLLSKFDAWTGPSGGDTIVITYWKFNEVPYGLQIDTDNIISRFSRTLTRGSALPAEGAATTTSDTENCTGYPLKDLGDNFKGSALWADRAQSIDFSDHTDFSFSTGGSNTDDEPFSFIVWCDLIKTQESQYLLSKFETGQEEYQFSLDTDGKLVVRFTEKGTATDFIQVATNSGDLGGGVLRCFGFSYSGSGDKFDLKIYVDGVLIGSNLFTENGYDVGMTAGTADVVVKQIDGSNIYNAQLYNRELSANEVKAIFDLGPYR